MSIYEAGGVACGLCSVTNYTMFLHYLKGHIKNGQTFIIMLDNDYAGQQCQNKIIKGLQNLGIDYLIANYPKGIKDPNQYLQEDPAGFKNLIVSLKEEALKRSKSISKNIYNAFDLLNYF